MRSVAWSLRSWSGEHFGELDQVAEGVAEDREAAADGGQDERLGDDRHARARSCLTVSSTLETARQKW